MESFIVLLKNVQLYTFISYGLCSGRNLNHKRAIQEEEEPFQKEKVDFLVSSSLEQYTIFIVGIDIGYIFVELVFSHLIDRIPNRFDDPLRTFSEYEYLILD